MKRNNCQVKKGQSSFCPTVVATEQLLLSRVRCNLLMPPLPVTHRCTDTHALSFPLSHTHTCTHKNEEKENRKGHRCTASHATILSLKTTTLQANTGNIYQLSSLSLTHTQGKLSEKSFSCDQMLFHSTTAPCSSLFIDVFKSPGTLITHRFDLKVDVAVLLSFFFLRLGSLSGNAPVKESFFFVLLWKLCGHLYQTR